MEEKNSEKKGWSRRRLVKLGVLVFVFALSILIPTFPALAAGDGSLTGEVGLDPETGMRTQEFDPDAIPEEPGSDSEIFGEETDLGFLAAGEGALESVDGATENSLLDSGELDPFEDLFEDLDGSLWGEEGFNEEILDEEEFFDPEVLEDLAAQTETSEEAPPEETAEGEAEEAEGEGTEEGSDTEAEGEEEEEILAEDEEDEEKSDDEMEIIDEGDGSETGEVSAETMPEESVEDADGEESNVTELPFGEGAEEKDEDQPTEEVSDEYSDEPSDEGETEGVSQILEGSIEDISPLSDVVDFQGGGGSGSGGGGSISPGGTPVSFEPEPSTLGGISPYAIRDGGGGGGFATGGGRIWKLADTGPNPAPLQDLISVLENVNLHGEIDEPRLRELLDLLATVGITEAHFRTLVGLERNRNGTYTIKHHEVFNALLKEARAAVARAEAKARKEQMELEQEAQIEEGRKTEEQPNLLALVPEQPAEVGGSMVAEPPAAQAPSTNPPPQG